MPLSVKDGRQGSRKDLTDDELAIRIFRLSTMLYTRQNQYEETRVLLDALNEEHKRRLR